MRIGAVVSVWGKADVDPTTGSTFTQLGISLPLASDFANAHECAGTASEFDSGKIVGDPTNNRAEMQFTSVDTANHAVYFNYGYRVL